MSPYLCRYCNLFHIRDIGLDSSNTSRGNQYKQLLSHSLCKAICRSCTVFLKGKSQCCRKCIHLHKFHRYGNHLSNLCNLRILGFCNSQPCICCILRTQSKSCSRSRIYCIFWWRSSSNRSDKQCTHRSSSRMSDSSSCRAHNCGH